ncbi:MAG: glycosyltransferase [Bilophila wadsworthia]|jgi:teichuronic acid biosynthesis glycosyltransferase TuaH|uniref:glycosyltransferase n=1 Tax=Bilophila wadsworthia TaxID=35833 RepID=UPI0024310D0B|nr:glycosyltransferase [Bilophila wadsworthia]
MKILYFSSIPWGWIKQRPQFIVEALGLYPDIYVDYVALVPFPKQIYPILKYEKHISYFLFSVCPFASKMSWIEKVNAFFIKKFLENRQYDKIILTDPRQLTFIPKKNKNINIIYDCMDNLPAFFSGKKSEHKIYIEQKMFRYIDKAIVSSKTLKEVLLARNPSFSRQHIIVVNNALSDQYVQSCMTKAHLRLKSPSMLYVGTIDDWIDFSAIEQLKGTFPDWNIYLVGPCRVKKNIINRLAGVHFMPPVPHSHIRELCQQAELLLMPFKINELILSVNPVKIYEYIASGKPILSSYWPELNYFLEKYPNLYFYTKNLQPSEVFKNINFEKVCVSDSFIKENTWSSRAKDYYKILKSI